MTEADFNAQLEAIARAENFVADSALLSDMWRSNGAGVEAVGPVLRFMEKYPSIEYGVPGPLVHFVEEFFGNGYERLLLESLTRNPTPTTIWMLKRLINGTTSPESKQIFAERLNEAEKMAYSLQEKTNALEQVFDQLTTLPMFMSDTPATMQEIGQIESELNVTLPPQYRQFLMRFGYAGWFGHEILGKRPLDPTTGDPSKVIPDCVSETKKARLPDNLLGTSDFPPNHLVVSADGSGGVFVLFTCGSPLEGEVHWFNFEDSPHALMVWRTFQDFMQHQIKNAVAP